MTTKDLLPLTYPDGRPSKYTRYADVESQIRDLLTRPPDQWPVASLKPQVLIYLMRHALPADVALLGRWCDALAGHALRVIQNYSKGFDAITSNLIAEDVLATLMLDVFFWETSGQQFLECNFTTAIKHRTLNVTRRYKGVVHVERSAVGDDENILEEPEIERQDALAALMEIEEPEIREKAFRAIKDPRHHEAIVLRYREGWPIHDADPSRPTLCTRFGLTPRQMNNWINIAKRQMRAALGDD